MDDRELLSRAEEALTKIEMNQGLSEQHAAVLAALRIRLTGSDTKSLEEMLLAAEEPGSGTLEEKLAEAERTPPKPSLDDLFAGSRSRSPTGRPDLDRLRRDEQADRLRALWDFDDLDTSERRLREQLAHEANDAGDAEV